MTSLSIVRVFPLVTASLTSLIMNTECRKFLKGHIQVFLEKNPGSSVKIIKKWLLSGDQPYDLKQVAGKALRRFIDYQVHKFSEHGQCVKHLCGNGCPSTLGRIKKLMVNKKKGLSGL